MENPITKAHEMNDASIMYKNTGVTAKDLCDRLSGKYGELGMGICCRSVGGDPFNEKGSGCLAQGCSTCYLSSGAHPLEAALKWLNAGGVDGIRLIRTGNAKRDKYFPKLTEL